MTKVVFYKRNGVYYGFRESGHAGFADAGQDILCAAISAMTMLVVNTLEVTLGLDVTYTVDERSTDITVICRGALPDGAEEKKQFAASSLLYSYYLQLNDMLEDYYDFLDVDAVEQE